MAKRKLDPTLGKRLNMRLAWPDYTLLLELRLALRLASDSATLRELIRTAHVQHKREIAAARKAPLYKERLQELSDGARQVDLFGGKKNER